MSRPTNATVEMPSASPTVRVERDGPLLIVTLDSPARRNAVNADAQRALDDIWRVFFDDPELKVAILTGAGDQAFCAGADMENLSRAGRDIAAAEPRSEYGHFGLTHRLDNPKPIIAAVNGIALGGGFEMVLCCDIVVAAEHSVFGLPEPLMGGAALAGGIARVCRKLPSNVAAGLLLTARRMPASEAARHGLVNEVVPVGQALSAARRWASDILRCAPLSIAVTKRLLNTAAAGGSLESLLNEGDALLDDLMTSADVQEGISAFVEKRPPVWSGR